MDGRDMMYHLDSILLILLFVEDLLPKYYKMQPHNSMASFERVLAIGRTLAALKSENMCLANDGNIDR